MSLFIEMEGEGMVASVGMGGKPKAPTGYDEWATTKVNIAYGCENDCVYCFAKLIGYDDGWAVRGQWHNLVCARIKWIWAEDGGKVVSVFRHRTTSHSLFLSHT